MDFATCAGARVPGHGGIFEGTCSSDASIRCGAVAAGSLDDTARVARRECFVQQCVAEIDFGGGGGRGAESPAGHCAPKSDEDAPGLLVDPTYATQYEGASTPLRLRATRRLHALFARIFGLFTWNSSAGSYTTEPLTAYVSDEVPEDISAREGNPPSVRAVGFCNQDGSCIEGGDGITVNGVSNADVGGSGGSLPVTLKFFGFARDNQMPIRSVKIDWDGDLTSRDMVSPGPGLYRNHRGTSASGVSLCDGTGFGRIEGKTCDSTAPFTYNFVYSCPSGANLASVRRAAGLNDAVCTGRRDATDTNCWNDSRQACQFIPRVQVLDNWGFCNGVCPDNDAGNNCYVGSFDECLTNSAWTPFSNRVLVRPR